MPTIASSSPLRIHASRAALLLSAVLAAVNSAFFFPRLVDDAFISLRYAENLAAGHGLVYNRGEWVEGYSSLTWVLGQAAGIALGLDGITATKLLSLLSLVALLLGVHRAARELFDADPLWAGLAAALVASNAYVISWGWYGLETPLYLALLVWSAVWVKRAAEGANRAGLALGAVGLALSLTRPEAPFMLAAAFVGGVRVPDGRGALDALIRRLALPAALVAAGYGAFLAMRHALYGHWVPHTYFAKRGGEGLELSHLASLFGEGAVLPEQVFWAVGALAALATFAATRRLLVPAVVLANLFFVAKVELDWMPNMRHLLPAWVFGSLGLLGLVHPRFSANRLATRVVAPLTLALVVALGGWLVSIDSRFSPYEFPTHGGGVEWVRPKRQAEWASALALARRREPPGFEAKHPDHLGLIDLTFLAVEASPAPEEETWFLGRDIGMVGYFSPIGVYEYVGLFTPEAIAWTAGDERAPVPDEAILAAFERPIVAGQTYGAWAVALGRHPEIVRRFAIREGHLRHPLHFVQRTLPPPSARELEARYARVRAKMPALFHFSELYGSPAGPAIELRARVAVERAARREAQALPRRAR